jgi:hypothetical protein
MALKMAETVDVSVGERSLRKSCLVRAPTPPQQLPVNILKTSLLPPVDIVT